MRYNKIRKMDVSNGPGIRVSIFMQGCTFNCKNCFNPETHDFNGGKEFTDETIERVLQLCDNNYIEGLSILGGEPMHPNNIEGTTKLAKAFKERFPNKTVWSWTGFLYENLKDKDVVNYLDVLVDGIFKEELHNPKLEWRGSSNQRVIDMKKTIQNGYVVSFI
ncbi:MAG: anaerobic ribonucleoside-triphosphate reductase activating protein [Clostridia bacterium]|nr:anaerobic ribonucleoside-triphosphate reductase activating protein [Clostridia bacterium]